MLFEKNDSPITKRVGLSYIKLNKDKSCPLLGKNKLCGHYKDRPSLCRAYPFYIDMHSGLNIDSSCPGIGKGWTAIDDLNETIQSLSKIYNLQIDNLDDYKRSILSK